MSLFKATRRGELPTRIGCCLGVLVSPLHLDESVYHQQGVSMELPMRLEAFLADQTNNGHTASSSLKHYGIMLGSTIQWSLTLW